MRQSIGEGVTHRSEIIVWIEYSLFLGWSIIACDIIYTFLYSIILIWGGSGTPSPYSPFPNSIAGQEGSLNFSFKTNRMAKKFLHPRPFYFLHTIISKQRGTPLPLLFFL